LININQ